MGQRKGFSKGDLTKINQMYNCPEKTLEVTNSTTTSPQKGQGTTSENSNPLVNVAQGILGLIFHR